MKGKRVLTGKYFMMGNMACAEGALAAGCEFAAGYPITPATEIANRLAERLPQVGGIFLQMEDEISSIATIIGASWTGKKVMTATSGPGISLMLENLGFAIAVEEIERALAAPSVPIEPPSVNSMQPSPPQSNPNGTPESLLRSLATEFVVSGNLRLSTERWRFMRSVWITTTKGLKALTRFALTSLSTEKSGRQGVTRFHAWCARSMIPRGTWVPSSGF